MTPLLWYDIAELKGWEDMGEPEARTDALMEDEKNEQYGRCPECEGVGTIEGDITCPTCKGKKVLCYNKVNKDGSPTRWIERQSRRAELESMLKSANEDESYK